MVRACSFIVLLAYCGCHQAHHVTSSGWVGRAAPDFELTDLAGRATRLSDFAGTPVVLTFFGHGCMPCQMEAPHLTRLAREHRDAGLTVMAVNGWNDPPNQLRRWARQRDLEHRILLNGRAVQEQYGFDRVPVTLFIDRAGRVTAQQEGFKDPAALEREIHRLIAGPAPSRNSS